MCLEPTKPMDGDYPPVTILTKPMMPSSNDQAHLSQERYPHWENIILSASTLNLNRIGPNGKENRDQDHGRETDGKKRKWKYPNGGANSTMVADEELQIDAKILHERDESPRTHRSANAWGSNTQPSLEKDRENSGRAGSSDLSFKFLPAFSLY